MTKLKTKNIYQVLAVDNGTIEYFEGAYTNYDDAKSFIYKDMERREIEVEDMKAHFEYDYQIKEIKLHERV